MKTAYIQAESPIKGDNSEMKSLYASMTSSCSYNGPAATKTATGIVISSQVEIHDAALRVELTSEQSNCHVELYFLVQCPSW
jgi:hypothetical protein